MKMNFGEQIGFSLTFCLWSLEALLLILWSVKLKVDSAKIRMRHSRLHKYQITVRPSARLIKRGKAQCRRPSTATWPQFTQDACIPHLPQQAPDPSFMNAKLPKQLLCQIRRAKNWFVKNSIKHMQSCTANA